MVTSYANRTSPVLRGKWILENILGSPPPPPPPNVPAFKEDEPGQPPTSVRARLEQHRQNPVCAACHARMDPLGFALENFDAVGKWRTEDGNAPSIRRHRFQLAKCSAAGRFGRRVLATARSSSRPSRRNC